MAKVFVFRAAIDAGYWQLALVGVLTSVLALAFYLRVIVVMYTRDPARPEEAPGRVPATVAVVLAVCVVLTLAFGILPAGALDLTSAALAAGVP